MFRLDNHLIPLPTPDSTEQIMTMTSAASMATTVGVPSGVINQCAPMMLNTLDANCDPPQPMVTATPRIVATTDTMSMTWPNGPSSVSPNSGVSTDRIVSGKPRA
jgi:hypothetical protein